MKQVMKIGMRTFIIDTGVELNEAIEELSNISTVVRNDFLNEVSLYLAFASQDDKESMIRNLNQISVDYENSNDQSIMGRAADEAISIICRSNEDDVLIEPLILTGIYYRDIQEAVSPNNKWETELSIIRAYDDLAMSAEIVMEAINMITSMV